MGIAVLVLGESGSGKSTSLRNFSKEDVCILNVARKPLPFKNNLTRVDNKQGSDSDFYKVIWGMLKSGEYKSYVIDDSQYLMAFEEFRRSDEKGYGKFTDIAKKFEQLLETINLGTSDDTIVYLLHHCEYTDDGRMKAKTSGKMIDNKLTVEGLFTIVLKSECVDGKYKFITNGTTPVKSPMGMFTDKEIENDLKKVDETIRAYYEI